jgi:hypothetical protein
MSTSSENFRASSCRPTQARKIDDWPIQLKWGAGKPIGEIGHGGGGALGMA